MSRDSIPAAAADPAQLRRLRWRARRGLLENDLLLGRFFDRHEERLRRSAVDVHCLLQLLELPDGVLLDLMLGVEPPPLRIDTPRVRELLDLLRSD
jgi:antitoxin CptB